jgi:predicted RNase H-like nuclease (RuvC/YqgF family)
MIDSIDHLFITYEEERLKLHQKLLELHSECERHEGVQKELQKQVKMSPKSETHQRQLDSATSRVEDFQRKLQAVRDELGMLCKISSSLLAAKNKKYARSAPVIEVERLMNSTVLDQISTSEVGKTIARDLMWRVYSLGMMNAMDLILETEARKKLKKQQ